MHNSTRYSTLLFLLLHQYFHFLELKNHCLSKELMRGNASECKIKQLLNLAFVITEIISILGLDLIDLDNYGYQKTSSINCLLLSNKIRMVFFEYQYELKNLALITEVYL